MFRKYYNKISAVKPPRLQTMKPKIDLQRADESLAPQKKRLEGNVIVLIAHGSLNLKVISSNSFVHNWKVSFLKLDKQRKMQQIIVIKQQSRATRVCPAGSSG